MEEKKIKKKPSIEMEKEDHSLWVFGYGSLCWNPGFQYGDSVVGHIEGFSRKFWQGNTTHRGTEEKVGWLYIYIYIYIECFF